MDEKDLRAMILMAGAGGELEEGLAHEMLNVLGGAPILRLVPSDDERALGIGGIYETLDSEGNVLVPGRNYMLNGGKVKVLREEHGAGNMLDVFKWVFYLDASLEEKSKVVNGGYPKGIFGGAVYKSQFEPIKED